MIGIIHPSVSTTGVPIGLKARPEGFSALCTYQFIPLESLTSKMKVKDVDDLDEN